MASERVHLRVTLAGGATAAAGVMLFAWVIQRAGPEPVLAGVRRVGAGIIVVALLGGLRGLIRTIAWRFCLEPADRLPLASMFATYLAGDAIGNVTPFGFFASEPSKVLLVRRRIDMRSSTAALAVENLFYSATVVVMLLAGTAAFLLVATVPSGIGLASLATAASAAVAASFVGWVVATRRRIISGALEWLVRRGVAPGRLAALVPRVRDVGDRMYSFVERRPHAVLPLLALETSYHAAAVVEIAFTLSLITGSAPALLTAFVLEYVNRTITVVFQFVPLWLGIDEAGTSLVTELLQLGPATGVALALVRKTRVVIWTAIGLALLPGQAVAARSNPKVVL